MRLGMHSLIEIPSIITHVTAGETHAAAARVRSTDGSDRTVSIRSASWYLCKMLCPNVHGIVSSTHHKNPSLI